MDILKVFLWGEEIGRLAWHPVRQLSYFTFNQEFLQRRLDLAPLTVSVGSLQSRRPIFGQEGRKYQGLPPFIADSLPDAWGNQLFERWRVTQRMSERSVSPLHKLAFIGRRGMGALEFMPEIDRGRPGRIDIKALADLAARVMADRENARILPNEALTMQALILVGTSAGGRQPKAILAINDATGEVRSGQVDVGPGFKQYILKFGDPARCTAETEQTYYQMALDAGINMMPSRLLQVDGTMHFLTLRFDRDATGKLYTQTLAAVCPGVESYEGLLTVCRRLRLPETDCREVFRRMVFNILANNTDDHDKNFSFIMDRQGRWRLAPAYDLTYIFNYGGYQPEREHCLMAMGKRCDFTTRDMLSFAKENGIKQPQAIIRKVATAVASFREKARENGVRDDLAALIADGIHGYLAAWGFEHSSIEGIAYCDSHGRQVTDASICLAYKGNY